MVQIEQIGEKSKKIIKVISQLKKEFIGIDEQIDTIMSNVKMWYLFSSIQTAPLIINLYGLTGVGKTSLVKRIFQLLDLQEDIIDFNFSGVSEFSQYELLRKLEDSRKIDEKPRIFIFDEFQNASTLNEMGNERDNRGMMATIWELLDTGTVYTETESYYIQNIIKVRNLLSKINSQKPIILENNEIVNASSFQEELSPLFGKVFNPSFVKDQNPIIPQKQELSEFSRVFKMWDYDFFQDLFNQIQQIERKKYEFSSINDFIKETNNFDIYDYIALFDKIIKRCKRGVKLSFHNSIIFVIGNLDESFIMANDIRPDMSADVIHNWSKKISIVNIKEALQKRFRNEQIARLGNTHIIYPSFSSENFKKIIDKELNEFSESIYKKIQLKIQYDNKIKDFIYKDGVFPTHGVRPIQSTINSVVKLQIPIIYNHIIEKNLLIDYITLSYERKHIIVYCVKDNNIIDTFKIKYKGNLNCLRDSTKDDDQAITAVHESGHFIIYSILNDKLPNKVVAKTAQADCDGFVSTDNFDFGSYGELKASIMMSMAGYVAENLVFGKNMLTNGASADIKYATELAMKIIREYGMGSSIIPICSTELSQYDYRLHDTEESRKSYQNKISDLIASAKNDVWRILTNESVEKAFKESCKYLMNHSELPIFKMKQIFNMIDKKIINQYKYPTNYRTIATKWLKGEE